MKKNLNSENKRKAWIILFLLILFSLTIGFLIGKTFDAGMMGSTIGGIFAVIYAGIAYFWADKLLLSSLGAKNIQRDTNVHLYQRVQQLAEEAEIPTPDLYYINDSAVNILSLGRTVGTGKIIITKGLIEKFTTPEVEAVLAHEIIHIKNSDTLPGSYAAVIVGIFPFYAELLKRKHSLFLPFSFFLSLFSPLSALLMHLVLSPKREIDTDAAGVLITKYPQGLLQALEKITHDPYSVKTAMQATAHLFIVNPFHGKANRSASPLFTTHPSVQERMHILQEM